MTTPSTKLGRNPFEKAKLRAIPDVPSMKEIIREEKEAYQTDNQMEWKNTSRKSEITMKEFSAKSPEFFIANHFIKFSANTYMLALKILVYARDLFSRSN